MDHAFVYVVTAREIVRVPRSGDGTKKLLASGRELAHAALDRDSVYVTAETAPGVRALMRVSKAGGQLINLAHPVRNAPFTLHGGQLYFVVAGAPELRRTPVSGGPSTLVARDDAFESLTAIAADELRIYVGTEKTGLSALARARLIVRSTSTSGTFDTWRGAELRRATRGPRRAMVPVMHSNTLVVLAIASVTALAVVGCGGPPRARAGSDERVPADGSAGGPAPSSLPPKAITHEEWAHMATEKLKPTCDGRAGSRSADAQKLEAAGKIIGTWTEFSKKAKGGEGKKSGGGGEPTRSVKSVGMTCSAESNVLAVNGVQYPFDMAWVVAGQGTGPTMSGDEGVGHFALIQALSLKDKKLIVAKVFVPSDANDQTDDTVVVSNLTSYLPDNVDEPVVRAVSERGNPFLETFVFAKGAREGFTFQVPQEDTLGRSRYLAVGRFALPKE